MSEDMSLMVPLSERCQRYIERHIRRWIDSENLLPWRLKRLLLLTPQQMTLWADALHNRRDGWVVSLEAVVSAEEDLSVSVNAGLMFDLLQWRGIADQ
jgi:hypothetical protein